MPRKLHNLDSFYSMKGRPKKKVTVIYGKYIFTNMAYVLFFCLHFYFPFHCNVNLIFLLNNCKITDRQKKKKILNCILIPFETKRFRLF